jgi:hypothetical protein
VSDKNLFLFKTTTEIPAIRSTSNNEENSKAIKKIEATPISGLSLLILFQEIL